MARPSKVGLDYFPMDVNIDQDDKVALIEAEFGLVGFAVVMKLFMKIYSEGYFYTWDEQAQLLFSSRLKMAAEEISAIVDKALKWGLFDRGKFDKYQILTSRGIQRRFLEATFRRKDVEFSTAYCMDGINVDSYSNLHTVNVDINPVNVDINAIKKRKVKYSKEEKCSASAEALEISKLMHEKVLEILPSFKAPNHNAWAREFDLMIRIDGRAPEDIRFMVQAVSKHPFWCKNILSPSKLRKQYDRLTLEVKGVGKGAFQSSKYANVG